MIGLISRQTLSKGQGGKKEKNNWVVKYIGAIDDNYENLKEVKRKYVEEAVNALLKNKAIETKTTKAIGCGIKWKKR